MNWYKLAKKINFWEMTRDQYNSIPLQSLKPHDIFYIPVGSKNVEIIQNPTSSDIRQMTKEVYREFPNFSRSTPALRSTQDENGNKYYWKAHESVHYYIEPQLSKIVGEELNQNANKPLYYKMIYDAIKSGKNVPPQVLNEFSEKYPDVVFN